MTPVTRKMSVAARASAASPDTLATPSKPPLAPPNGQSAELPYSGKDVKDAQDAKDAGVCWGLRSRQVLRVTSERLLPSDKTDKFTDEDLDIARRALALPAETWLPMDPAMEPAFPENWATKQRSLTSFLVKYREWGRVSLPDLEARYGEVLARILESNMDQEQRVEQEMVDGAAAGALSSCSKGDENAVKAAVPDRRLSVPGALPSSEADDSGDDDNAAGYQKAPDDNTLSYYLRVSTDKSNAPAMLYQDQPGQFADAATDIDIGMDWGELDKTVGRLVGALSKTKHKHQDQLDHQHGPGEATLGQEDLSGHSTQRIMDYYRKLERDRHALEAAGIGSDPAIQQHPTDAELRLVKQRLAAFLRKLNQTERSKAMRAMEKRARPN